MKTTYGLPKKREEVLQALQTAYANQNLDDEEYETRINQALKASCIEDLKLIVFDFPKEIKEPLFSEIAAPTTQNNDINSDLPIINRESFRSILSEDKQDVKMIGQKAVDFFTLLGEQEVDFRHCVLNGNNFRINVNCYLGSSVLDLRNENLDGKNIDIFVNNIFGEVKIYIPPGGIVQQNLQKTIGDFSIKDKRKSWLKRILGTPEAIEEHQTKFTIRIHGSLIFGSVVVIF